MSGFVDAHKLSLLNVVKQSTSRVTTEQAATNLAIPGGTTDITIDHTFGTASIYPAFTPNWNTTVWVTEITSSAIRARFGVCLLYTSDAADE